ncbi:hypothetical protein SUNI508_00378 [Seiridium unicorne]|uniref:Uncharacterized protein n=1 Tax=Seiridium unicorne TaxID=138068 RepID=A0ABR2V6I5_9PEZI
MADSNYYWPGGIPSHIRCRAGPLDETCRKTAKGWQLFLEGNAVARDPGNAEEGFEIEQRLTFHYFDRASLSVDQKTLDTGRLLLCELGDNGQVHASSRMWPLWTYMAYCYVYGLGWYGGRVIDDYILAAEDYNANAPLNMELPILELLKAKQEYFGNDVDIDYWTEPIEDYAPGYSEMEAAGNGMAPDFDHANLMDG